MSQAAKKIEHLLGRSRKAQDKRDCAGAYYAMIQAVKEYTHQRALGGILPGEGADLSHAIAKRVDEVFDGCIGR